MASISFIRGRWRVQVRRKGARPLQRSFDTKREAQNWAASNALQKPSDRVRIGDLIRAYLLDRRAGRTKAAGLRAMAAGPLGEWRLDRVTVDDLVAWGRSRRCAPPTLALDFSFLGSVLKDARLRGIAVPDVLGPAREVLAHEGLIGKPQERDRRPTEDEIARIVAWLQGPRTRVPWADLIWFSIWTTMRASEVTSIRWADLNASERTVLVRDRKDPRKKVGNHQWVPLLDPAWEIVQRQPKRGERIFPHDSGLFSNRFPRACAALGIEDLRWHDLRHEGISRLFEMGYQIHEVALFSGHKDWKQLARYTQLRAGKLRRLTAASSPPRPTPSSASLSHAPPGDRTPPG